MAAKQVPLKSLSRLPQVRSAVRRRGARAISLADAIGKLAEPPLQEFRSADLLTEFLAESGFRVTRPWKDLPTAFRAAAGEGQAVIAILAEYDALPDCGAKSGLWGHGCGHNLLGVAAALAGAVAADVLRKPRPGRAGKGGRGRIIVFGCPAEEGLAGKVFMAARRGFAGLDAVLAWHPDNATRANVAGGAAMDSILFKFGGRTSHAAGGPEQGRSALDAAVLTDVAVNYLREHTEENTRMHSVITEGGAAPNVVPDQAEIWYYVRGKDRKQVDDLRRRVLRCVRGAAMATETRWKMTVQTCITERVPNRTLAGMLDRLLHRCGPPRFTRSDARAASRIARGKRYASDIEPVRTVQGRGSSDEDNVSWFAPLITLNVACIPKGVPGHHRLYAALSVGPGAHRGMLKAAEVLALSAVELALNAPLLRKAQAEFRQQMRRRKYRLPLPPDAAPPPYTRPPE